MNNQLQILLGVAAVGAAGYFIFKETQKPKSFTNFRGMPTEGLEGGYRPFCKGRNERLGTFQMNDKTYYWCCQPGFFTDNRPDLKFSELETED